MSASDIKDVVKGKYGQAASIGFRRARRPQPPGTVYH